MKDKEGRKDEDLKEVMRGEKRRGASRASVSRQKDQQLMKDLVELLQIADEREYIQAIKKRFPITETSPQFPRALQIWREQHGGGRYRG